MDIHYTLQNVASDRSAKCDTFIDEIFLPFQRSKCGYYAATWMNLVNIMGK